ncbi:hypothetical protein BXZ70DRAFT_272813 [Cristinia sonorae]|uniref:Uncharacterized protein n=1 Tax=Cristinia sonorae TaxID=1940300 RepID=A0A8K0UYS2_9AGAR|nr:hypothetical protein BXZ70DRAFT_272813 [Cristinia sonorae]
MFLVRFRGRIIPKGPFITGVSAGLGGPRTCLPLHPLRRRRRRRRRRATSDERRTPRREFGSLPCPTSADEPCERWKVRFFKSKGCEHLTFTGENTVDCASQDCFLSKDHRCRTHSPSCRCRRYYTQPERITTHEVDGLCPLCVKGGYRNQRR